MEKTKIIIAGGSGFLGRALAQRFSEKGYEVVILSRQKQELEFARVEVWDGVNLGDWAKEFENALAVINLSGRSVDCRYNQKNRKLIMDSRIKSTKVIGDAINACSNPPKVWLNASTATIYEHTYGQPQTEQAGRIAVCPDVHDEFSCEVAHRWEQALNDIDCKDSRKIALRLAIVFGREKGTVFHIMKRLVKFGLGGQMGHGKQYVSWIHEDDFCNAVDWLIRSEHTEGVYNLSAPEPLPNREMMSAFRKICKMPFGLPATKWMLEIGAFFMRTETELILKSRRVVPERLVSEGFEFKYSTFPEALKGLQE